MNSHHPSNLSTWSIKNRTFLKVATHTWTYGLVLALIVLSHTPSLRGQTISSTITTNWNKAPAGDDLWMSSVFTMKSPVTEGETLFISNASVSFPFNGPIQTVDLPNAEVIFSSAYSSTTTTFNAASDTWITTAPLSAASKNLFLTGGEWQIPSPGLLSNISGNHVSMSAAFSVANTAAPASLDWKWSTAAYNTFSTDLNALGVKAIDGSGLHAGTPTNYDVPSYVDQGGSGGGACNFTGSYSGTACLNVPVAPIPEPGSVVFLIAAAAMFVLKRSKFRKFEV